MISGVAAARCFAPDARPVEGILGAAIDRPTAITALEPKDIEGFLLGANDAAGHYVVPGCVVFSGREGCAAALRRLGRE